MDNKKIEFDKYGKCPLCKKPFRSKVCSHNYGYVYEVVYQANMKRDVDRLRRK